MNICSRRGVVPSNLDFRVEGEKNELDGSDSQRIWAKAL